VHSVNIVKVNIEEEIREVVALAKAQHVNVSDKERGEGNMSTALMWIMERRSESMSTSRTKWRDR
jgi:hypothetical protein